MLRAEEKVITLLNLLGTEATKSILEHLPHELVARIQQSLSGDFKLSSNTAIEVFEEISQVTLTGLEDLEFSAADSVEEGNTQFMAHGGNDNILNVPKKPQKLSDVSPEQLFKAVKEEQLPLQVYLLNKLSKDNREKYLSCFSVGKRLELEKLAGEKIRPLPLLQTIESELEKKILEEVYESY